MSVGPLGEYFGQRTWSMVIHKGKNHDSRSWEMRIGPPPRSLWIQCTSHACWHGMVRVGMTAGDVVDIVVDSILCEVSKPLFTQEVTSRKGPCSLDDFLVVEVFDGS